jgi:hypothetical protein
LHIAWRVSRARLRIAKLSIGWAGGPHLVQTFKSMEQL